MDVTPMMITSTRIAGTRERSRISTELLMRSRFHQYFATDRGLNAILFFANTAANPTREIANQPINTLLARLLPINNLL